MIYRAKSTLRAVEVWNILFTIAHALVKRIRTPAQINPKPQKGNNRALQLAAVRAVSGQLERFGGGMAADSEAQRSVMRGLLEEEAQRAEAAVAEVLQPSNVGALAAYVFGGKKEKGSDMPVAQVRSRIVGARFRAFCFAALRCDHGQWLVWLCVERRVLRIVVSN